MKITKSLAIWIASGLFVCSTIAAQAQVSDETLESISMPDKVNTSIGTLNFFDGVPTEATINKLYDNLDLMRAVQVYLDNQGAASL